MVVLLRYLLKKHGAQEQQERSQVIFQMTFWNIFWIVLGALGLLVLCSFVVFFIYCVFKVGAESERKEERV